MSKSLNKTPPSLPGLSSPPEALPDAADPALVPQHTNYQSVEPVLRTSLDRIDSIADRARNAFDTLLDSKPDTAAKYMFHMLRAEKLRADVIETYSKLAFESKKVVSTDRPDTSTSSQILNQGNIFMDSKALPAELEKMFINILGRKETTEKTLDVSTDSLKL